jgi:hypothetical protein
MTQPRRIEHRRAGRLAPDRRNPAALGRVQQILQRRWQDARRSAEALPPFLIGAVEQDPGADRPGA